MRLTAIGISGSFPGPDSAASCYLLEVGEESPYRIVLDLGNGALSELQRHIDLATIDAVVLSHLHPDHCFDITGLYVFRCYDPQVFCDGCPEAPGRPALPVYGPAGTRERLQTAYHTDPGLSPVPGDSAPTDLGATFEFRTLSPDSTHQLGPVELQSFLVDHPVEAYALRITDDTGAVLCYSGDTDACDNLDRAAAEADLFLCEAAFEEGRDSARGIHLTGARAGATATRAAVGRLVLTHIPAWTDRATVRSEAAAEYTGPIDLAGVGGRWQIGRGTATTTLPPADRGES